MTNKSKNIIKAVSDYGKGLFNFIRGKVSTEADAEDILQDVWYQFSSVINSEPLLTKFRFKTACFMECSKAKSICRKRHAGLMF